MEIQLRAGHPDVQGLCRALVDWSAELRLLRDEPRFGHPLRHVWPTFARVVPGWRDGQVCRDRRRGAASNANRSKKARRGRSRAGRKEASITTG